MFGEGLKGRFIAFAPDGAQLVTQQFAANLMSNSLSPDGNFAICQTASLFQRNRVFGYSRLSGTNKH